MIRDANVFDAEFMVSAKEYGFSDAFSLSVIKSSFCSDRFFGKIYLDREVPVAYITYSLSYDFADIESVFVMPDYRKQGIAKKLILEAEKHIKESGKEAIFLEVKPTNESAIKTYSSCGYKQIAVRAKYYSDGSDALIMRKEI